MNQRMMQLSARRGGYVMASVLLFLTLASGMWVLMFRASAATVRVENARMLRESRSVWTATALAKALSVLQTGTPNGQTYRCKVSVTQNGETRYFTLTFDKTTAARWTVRCTPTTASDLLPFLPASF